MKFKKRAILLLTVLAMILISVGVVYAVSFTIDERRPYIADTDEFVLNESGKYWYLPNDAALVSSVTVKRTHNANALEIPAFDLVVIVSDASVPSVSGKAPSEYPIAGGGKAFVFSNIALNGTDVTTNDIIETTQSVDLSLSGANSETAVKIAVLGYDVNNAYVNDYFSLSMINNEGAHDIAAGEGYKNLYFLGDITTQENFILNYPCHINFLWANLILNESFAIKHGGRGAFSITYIKEGRAVDALGEAIAPVDNTNASFTIETPLGYYGENSSYGGEYTEEAATLSVAQIVTNEANYTKLCASIDFAAAENSTLLDLLLTDAIAFASRSVPTRFYADRLLKNSYHHYDVEFSYAITNGTNNFSVWHGAVTRGVESQNVTVEITATGYGTTKTASLSCTIVGTGNNAIITALRDSFSDYIVGVSKSAATTTEGEATQVSYIDEPIDIKTFFDNFIDFSGFGGVLTVSSASNSYIKLLTGDTEANIATIDGTAKTISVATATVGLSDTAGVYLLPTDKITSAIEFPEETITFGLNGLIETTTVNLKSMSIEEKLDYIRRYMYTVYIPDTTSTSDMLFLNENGFYYGGTADENLVSIGNMGFTQLSYKVYSVDLQDFDELIETGILPDSYVDASGYDYTDYFEIQNGKIRATEAAVTIPTRRKTVYIATLNYGGVDYTFAREIGIPENGLGGSEYEQYISGDTYGDYFDSLPEGKLIDSTADNIAEQTVGNAYRMTASYPIGVEVTLLNPEAVGSFVSIQLTTPERGEPYYQINIDIDNIPDRNSLVRLQAKFTELVNNEEISTQNYSFTVPGIYRTGENGHIPDTNFYACILNAKNASNENLYESFNGYLLVDGAEAYVSEFDCSYKGGDVQSLNLEGVNLLNNTSSFIFDNYTILGGAEALQPFSHFGLNSDSVLSLSLKNCGITDEAFNKGYLFGLNGLQELYLDENSIASFGDQVIYRTLKTLSLKNQTGRSLNSIRRISELSELEVLDISGNSVASFNPLCELGTLTTVYLYDNAAVEFSNKPSADTNVYYGTLGEINIPVYVSLIDKGLTVYADSATALSVADSYTLNSTNTGILTISSDQRLASLILNAIIVMETQYGTITNIPNNVYHYSNGYTDESGTLTGEIQPLTVNYLIAELSPYQTVAAPAHTNNTVTTTITEDCLLRLIASTTLNGVTVYREFEFIYFA